MTVNNDLSELTPEQFFDNSDRSYQDSAAWYFRQAELEVERMAKWRAREMSYPPFNLWQILRRLVTGAAFRSEERPPEDLFIPPVVPLEELIGLGELALRLDDNERRQAHEQEFQRREEFRFAYSGTMDALASVVEFDLIPDEGYVGMGDLIDAIKEHCPLLTSREVLAAELARHFEIHTVGWGEPCINVRDIHDRLQESPRHTAKAVLSVSARGLRDRLIDQADRQESPAGGAA